MRCISTSRWKCSLESPNVGIALSKFYGTARGRAMMTNAVRKNFEDTQKASGCGDAFDHLTRINKDLSDTGGMGPVDENGLSAGDHGFPGFEDHNDWKTACDRMKCLIGGSDQPSARRCSHVPASAREGGEVCLMAKGVTWTAEEDRELIAGCKAGMIATDMAMYLCRSPSSVRNRIRHLKIKTRYGAAQPGSLRIRLRVSTWEALQAEAKKRGLKNASRLARAVIEMVIADKMIGAILDVTDKASRQRVMMVAAPAPAKEAAA